MDLQVMVGNLLMKEMEWCFTTLERGIHKGSYYGFSSGDTGKVKIVGKDYIDFSKDKATIIKFGGE